MMRFSFALAAAISISIFVLSCSNYARAAGGSGPLGVLSASDGLAGDGLGFTAAITDDTVFAANIIFQRGRDSTIYVFEKPNGGWTNMTENARLTIPSGFHNRGFTDVDSLAASHDVVVAGSRDGIGGGNLYVFVRPPTGWTDMTPTAVLRESTGGSFFGNNVAIDGDTIVAGDSGCTGNGDFGPGAAFVFQKPKAGWRDMTETGVFTASDAIGCDDFGGSVAISGDTVVVGATRGGFSPPLGPGEVYIFVKPQNGWQNMTQTAELSALTSIRLNQLGSSVAVSGNTVVADGSFAPNSLGIFVYAKPQGGWTNGTQTATLLASGFGPLAVNGTGTAVVSGTPFNRTNDTGTVREYLEPQTGWHNASHANQTFDGLSGQDSLGSSVGIEGSTLVAGAPGATVNGIAQGAVYVYAK